MKSKRKYRSIQDRILAQLERAHYASVDASIDADEWDQSIDPELPEEWQFPSIWDFSPINKWVN